MPAKVGHPLGAALLLSFTANSPGDVPRSTKLRRSKPRACLVDKSVCDVGKRAIKSKTNHRGPRTTITSSQQSSTENTRTRGTHLSISPGAVRAVYSASQAKTKVSNSEMTPIGVQHRNPTGRYVPEDGSKSTSTKTSLI